MSSKKKFKLFYNLSALKKKSSPDKSKLYKSVKNVSLSGFANSSLIGVKIKFQTRASVFLFFISN